MPPRAKTVPVAATTAQALGSLLKSARDIMRKDKGLNGDLDRLPLLTWIMFPKFLDDLEAQRQQGQHLRARSSGQPSRRRIAGATGRPTHRGSPATSCWPSSTRTKPSGLTASAVPASLPICATSQAPTATTAATSSPPCSAASTTA